MESKRLDISGRINAEELEDPKMASELLWCHIAPIILATYDLVERVWPGIFLKVRHYGCLYSWLLKSNVKCLSNESIYQMSIYGMYFINGKMIFFLQN